MPRHCYQLAQPAVKKSDCLTLNVNGGKFVHSSSKFVPSFFRPRLISELNTTAFHLVGCTLTFIDLAHKIEASWNENPKFHSRLLSAVKKKMSHPPTRSHTQRALSIVQFVVCGVTRHHVEAICVCACGYGIFSPD